MSTLANAMDVLKLIARLRRDITVTDVVTELGLPKSSASRTLSMMAGYGFLDRDAATRAYRPGGVIMEASYHFRASRNAASLVEEALDALVRDTGFTGYINVLDGADTLVIQMRAGAGALQIYTPPGSRAPAYSSAMGRALLARLGDDEVTALLGARLDQGRGDAPKTRKDLLARLAAVRERGWALSRGEYVTNVAGISSAVFDAATRQTYAFGIALPAEMLSDALVERFGTTVRDAAASVGKRVGDPFWLAFGAANP
ncbi:MULTISPECIES: IclR family transcriptional regulator [unclassified Variovorax]|uniref:IclR family transcriptional regulator n=1 Tax=unclassified Variovorax TaxID=663243 RepID=UPI0008BD0FA5|nr:MULTISPECIES: IclR family transcriptional regulator [unclassified Variovorax]SEK08318.1 transcriptional regulator, IclR family [Variovorax sp. OK202]SFD55258.1 transcriptional regulator, IclR family [Variovorax sp. OK212]